MKKFILLLVVALNLNIVLSQSSFKAILKDSLTNELLIGSTAVITGTKNGGIANVNGQIEIKNIPNGKFTVTFSRIGYEKLERLFIFPMTYPITIYLKSKENNSEDVIVEGTRSNKSINDIPTRVEVLTEEIDEASTMDPSKVSHLLTHSTGIQVQQTSATSNSANVRIQGLDGRYTQILKDGFPLYDGFGGSLSIMQIPPLDLRQVEYIKGGASTLYGGGAISGIINLISKEPTDENILIHLNRSSIGATDINAFIGKKYDKIGFTLLLQRNYQDFFDADKDNFSDMPKITKYNVNPRLILYLDENTKLTLGATFTDESKQGGDIKLMNNENADTNHFYKEINEIKRITTQLKFESKIDDNAFLTFRNSFNIFKRSLSIIPNKDLQEYHFKGNQLSSFSEFTYTYKEKKNVLITGLNFYSDNFHEDSLESPLIRNEEFKTIGAFVNYNIDISEKTALETGLRSDYVFNQKLIVLLRVSLLFKWTEKLSTRIGGGMGYRNPTIFNQEAELLAYQKILPIDKSKVNQENSYGGNMDLGYKTLLGENFFININQMFFYTYLNKPLILESTGDINKSYYFINANGYTRSFGAETFFKFGFYDFVLFVGYTYTNAANNYNNKISELTLTPIHSIKGDLLYSIPKQWRIGLDYEFKSSQILSSGLVTKSFWTFGAVIEYTWTNFTFFGNIENYTDVRQTNYGSLRSLPFGTPQFTEVWAPLDGIVFNSGVKIRFN